MSLLSIFSLAIAMFILAATPGPGVFATISRSLASGFVPSLAVIAGIVTGDIIFLLFAIMGLSVIAQAMGNFFVVIKIIGAAYLIFLGIKIWRSKPVLVQDVKKQKI
jgi:threonine/homoserine/homoserine lactone efflux protein